MQFKAMIGEHEITGDCVNPGEWFGKCYVIEIGCGYSSFYLAVEGGDEQDAIDNLCDSEEYGKHIRMDKELAEEREREFPDDMCYAGNASEPVDLENVHIHGEYANRMDDSMPVPSMKYIVGEITPIEYAKR